MFWKKNKKESEITVNLETHTQRQSFRVKSSKTIPIIVYVQTKRYMVHDLSAGGLSFSSTDFLENDILKIQLKLPLQDAVLNLTIQVLNISKNTMNQCKFLDIQEEESDIIHKFIMEYQKTELRRKKDLKKFEMRKKQQLILKKKQSLKIIQKETSKQKNIKQF